MSCALLGFGMPVAQTVNPVPPNVSVSTIELAAHPTAQQLAGYFCSEYLPAPANMFVCPAAFGSVNMTDLEFAFDLELRFQNPNQIPVPIVEALVAFTAYPSTSNQRLGALCISMCENPNSCPQNGPGACESNQPEIRDASSFASAAVGFLVRTATGQASLEDLRVRTIEPSGQVVLNVRLSLAPAQLLPLIKETVTNLVDRLRDRQIPSFSIPYRLEGTAFVTIEGLGRIAVDFGPVENSWNIIPNQN